MRNLGLLLGLILLWGCNTTEIAEEPELTYRPGEGVFLLNEGQFLAGNATVNYLQFEDGLLQKEVFRTINGFPLGDILQSATVYQDRIWLIVNNSGFVIGVNPENWKEEVLIEGLRSPRYFLGIDSRKAYVTDLFARGIHILDIQDGTKTGEISFPGWSEELVLLDERVVVAGRETSFLYLIDPMVDQIVDSIRVGFGPGQFAIDQEGLLWVYCSGDEFQDKPAGLFKLDVGQAEVVDSFYFEDWDLGGWPRLAFNDARDTLYYLKDGLYQWPVELSQPPSEPTIPSGIHNWYALGLDPRNSQIYLGDAGDFQESGPVLIYKPDGQIQDSLLSGVIPNGFLFY